MSAKPQPLRQMPSASAQDPFLQDVLAGLSRIQKSIPPKYLYDAEGSRLFDAICDLPEYYPTRTETAILAGHADDMAARIGPGAVVVEFGSGSSVKIRLLLDALQDCRGYVPVDISGEHLSAAALRLGADYPALPIQPVVADYTRPFPLPALSGRRVGFFPGSTIGNFSPGEAMGFLCTAAEIIGPGGGLLVGADRRKDPAVLVPAYDDAAGVTAAFNMNLLTRMNRELGADFEPDRFAHRARYDGDRHRIEMHLESLETQTVSIAGETFRFEAGETIHTENSHKFDRDSFAALAEPAGFRLSKSWTDAEGWFDVHWLELAS